MRRTKKSQSIANVYAEMGFHVLSAVAEETAACGASSRLRRWRERVTTALDGSTDLATAGGQEPGAAELPERFAKALDAAEQAIGTPRPIPRK